MFTSCFLFLFLSWSGSVSPRPNPSSFGGQTVLTKRVEQDATGDSVILGFDSGNKGIDWEFWHLSQPYRNKHPKQVRPRSLAAYIREVRAKERKLVMDDELPFKILNFSVQIATTMR